MNFIVKPDGLANIRQSENFVNAVQRAHGNNLTCAIQHGCNYTGIQQQIPGATWGRQEASVVIVNNNHISFWERGLEALHWFLSGGR